MEWIQTLLISGLCIPSFCADYRQHCLIETPKSWFDAQSYCRERGHDLATIDDMGAIKSMLALNADRAHDELWIGLHYTQQLLNVASLSNHNKIAWKTNSDGQVFIKEQCQEEDGDI
ncbi:unnamed protein product [Gadus morhua 'NCC']